MRCPARRWAATPSPSLSSTAAGPRAAGAPPAPSLPWAASEGVGGGGSPPGPPACAALLASVPPLPPYLRLGCGTPNPSQPPLAPVNRHCCVICFPGLGVVPPGARCAAPPAPTPWTDSPLLSLPTPPPPPRRACCLVSALPRAPDTSPPPKTLKPTPLSPECCVVSFGHTRLCASFPLSGLPFSRPCLQPAHPPGQFIDGAGSEWQAHIAPPPPLTHFAKYWCITATCPPSLPCFPVRAD